LNLLLDTHIWLWLVTDPTKLGRRTLQELRNSTNELWLSPISTWEILTLSAKGRIHLKQNPRDWLALATLGTREASLTHEIALEARELVLHQDPADRMLAATAKVLDLILVTADQKLLGLGAIRTLANR
jgi:PIN domain nuclease of toxin-antitoxin system